MGYLYSVILIGSYNNAYALTGIIIGVFIQCPMGTMVAVEAVL